jgi:hypothetical protein
MPASRPAFFRLIAIALAARVSRQAARGSRAAARLLKGALSLARELFSRHPAVCWGVASPLLAFAFFWSQTTPGERPLVSPLADLAWMSIADAKGYDFFPGPERVAFCNGEGLDPTGSRCIGGDDIGPSAGMLREARGLYEGGDLPLDNNGVCQSYDEESRTYHYPDDVNGLIWRLTPGCPPPQAFGIAGFVGRLWALPETSAYLASSAPASGGSLLRAVRFVAVSEQGLVWPDVLAQEIADDRLWLAVRFAFFFGSLPWAFGMGLCALREWTRPVLRALRGLTGGGAFPARVEALRVAAQASFKSATANVAASKTAYLQALLAALVALPLLLGLLIRGLALVPAVGDPFAALILSNSANRFAWVQWPTGAPRAIGVFCASDSCAGQSGVGLVSSPDGGRVFDDGLRRVDGVQPLLFSGIYFYGSQQFAIGRWSARDLLFSSQEKIAAPLPSIAPGDHSRSFLTAPRRVALLALSQARARLFSLTDIWGDGLFAMACVGLLCAILFLLVFFALAFFSLTLGGLLQGPQAARQAVRVARDVVQALAALPKAVATALVAPFVAIPALCAWMGSGVKKRLTRLAEEGDALSRPAFEREALRKAASEAMGQSSESGMTPAPERAPRRL